MKEGVIGELNPKSLKEFVKTYRETKDDLPPTSLAGADAGECAG